MPSPHHSLDLLVANKDRFSVGLRHADVLRDGDRFTLVQDTDTVALDHLEVFQAACWLIEFLSFEVIFYQQNPDVVAVYAVYIEALVDLIQRNERAELHVEAK